MQQGKSNILVLGAGSLQVPLIETVISKGYNPVVVSLDEHEPGMTMVKDRIVADFCDEEKTLEIAKKYNVCAVVSDQTDLPVRTVSYVANSLHLHSPMPYKTACVFTDKYLMRERCNELGIKTLRYRLCNTVKEVEDFVDRIGFPVILKPINNQGSKGVVQIDNHDELHNKLMLTMAYSRNNPFLVEEFVVGEELVIEAYTENGNVHNLICGDTHYFNIPDVFSAKQRIFPSQKSEDVVNKALRLNKAIIKGFGLSNGITHGEYIIVDDEVYLIEIAARGGGVFISSDIIPLMTGFDTNSFIVDSATGDVPNTTYEVNNDKCVCYLAFFLPKGVIISIDGFDSIIKQPYVHRHNLSSFYIGRKMKGNTDKTTRGFIVLEAKDLTHMNQIINNIKSTLIIKVLSDNIIQDVIWD